MMKIIQTPSPNFNERPSAIDAIIIHYTDMVSAEAALAWLTNPASYVSAHYLIDEGGQVYRMVNQEHRAWHAGESYWLARTNLNDCSIGIELANPGHSNGYTPFPEPQIDALIELCLEIKERWNIPSNRILGHSDIAPQRKQDPGHLFPWERLAQEGLGMWPSLPSTVHPSTSVPTGPTLRTNGRGNAVRPERRDPELGEGDRSRRMNPIETLSTIGYEVTSPMHTLLAFQRHFQPHKVDANVDQETYALLQGLLKSQEMLI